MGPEEELASLVIVIVFLPLRIAVISCLWTLYLLPFLIAYAAVAAVRTKWNLVRTTIIPSLLAGIAVLVLEMGPGLPGLRERVADSTAAWLFAALLLLISAGVAFGLSTMATGATVLVARLVAKRLKARRSLLERQRHDGSRRSVSSEAKMSRNQRIVIALLSVAVVIVFGCLGTYMLSYFTDGHGDHRPTPSAVVSPHPIPPTWTPLLLRPTSTPQPLTPTPTRQQPTPTNTRVIPLGTERPCPPAPTAEIPTKLSQLRESVPRDEERLMVEFLMRMYNPELGLLEESPNIGAGRFFVHADAYLAGLDVSWYEECYHLHLSPHWRVLRERVALPEDDIMWDVKELDLGGGVYSYEPDPEMVMPLDLWADRLLLAALSAKFAGNHEREAELLAQARQMWDGNCLQDEYYRWHEREHGHPACETFKTALYYHLTGDDDALSILLRMQETDPTSPNYGGIYNLYQASGERFPEGRIDANAETTAVVLLSLPSCARPPISSEMAPVLVQRWQSADTSEERLMVEFLMSMYKPALLLLQESPNVGADHHWVHSDAYLAGLDTSWYNYCHGLRPNPHWTVLRGEIVSEDVFAYTVEQRALDPANGVYTDVDRPDGLLTDWLEYADRLLLAGLNAHNAGNADREAELIALARDMWDGGCLRDKVYEDDQEQHGCVRCETYKTALYYLLTGDAGARRIVQDLQETDPASEHYGGVYTHYDEDGRPFPGSDANVETTAVVLLTIFR